MNIQSILDRIPEINEFLTVDEMDASTLALAEKYPDLASVTIAGKTTMGHPLYCLKIGEGKKKVFMYGAPHPNEPIGSMMLEHLSTILCEDPDLLKELDSTFYIIKASDGDGLRLNEGWLKGPFTYENYAKNFFRPNSPQQVEWTFPMDYKTYKFEDTISETAALMKMMDEIKPDIVYSLHNSSFGGVYFYITKDIPEITGKLAESANHAGLPLNLGEPEVPFSPVYAPAVYGLPTANQMYDFLAENMPGDPAVGMHGGGSSADYMNQVNPDGIVFMCEEPYFLCPDCNDLTECPDMTRKEAILLGKQKQKELIEELAKQYDIIKKYLDEKDPYFLSLIMYTNIGAFGTEAEKKMMDDHPEIFDVPVTKASRFDSLVGAPWYTMLGFGVVNGATKEILAREDLSQQQKAEVKAVQDKANQIIEDECARIEKINPCVQIPIKTLVTVQLHSALIALTNL